MKLKYYKKSLSILKNNRHDKYAFGKSDVGLHVLINSTLSLKIDEQERITIKALERL